MKNFDKIIITAWIFVKTSQSYFLWFLMIIHQYYHNCTHLSSQIMNFIITSWHDSIWSTCEICQYCEFLTRIFMERQYININIINKVHTKFRCLQINIARWFRCLWFAFFFFFSKKITENFICFLKFLKKSNWPQ